MIYKNYFIKNSILLILCNMTFTLSSCTVGPEFKKPEFPIMDRYTEKPLFLSKTSPKTKSSSIKIIKSDLSEEWWKLFKSSSLDRLIKKALANNPDLQKAKASLRQAQEIVYAQIGAYYPSINIGGLAQKQRTAKEIQPFTDSGSRLYSLYSGQINVSYIPDIFGANRRAVESLSAIAESERFELEAAHLTLTSNLVTTVIQEASLRNQIDVTKKLIKSSSEVYNLFKKEEELGNISRADTTAQEAVLARIEQSLPELEKQLALTRNQLTALIGDFPTNQTNQTNQTKEIFNLSDLKLPTTLPVSIPSKLLEHRPDIRAAEENLRAANADIGVAIANRLPNIIITADIGKNALQLHKLLNTGATIWGLAAGIAQPIFQGGALMHKQHAAVAAYDKAAAEYRSTVINAFRNVADTLQTLDFDNKTLQLSEHAENAAKRTLDFARKEWMLGNESYLSLVNAQQDYQQAVLDLIQARASRYSDTVALFQALGGGWNSNHDLNTSS